MYNFSTWKPGFVDGRVPASALPMPEDDAAGQYYEMDVGRPMGSLLSRLRGGSDDPSVPRRLPDAIPEHHQYRSRGLLAAEHFSPPKQDQTTSRFYTWKPTASTASASHTNAPPPQQAGDQRMLASLRHALSNKAAVREHRQTVPQKRRHDDMYPHEPQHDDERHSIQAREKPLQGNSRAMAVPRRHATSPRSPRQAPQQLPPLESELLEAIQDHYCEEGGHLSARVTNELGRHHGELCIRLKQVTSADDKFLQRLNTCNSLLSRPFSETITFRSDGKDSPVKMGAEVEKMRQKTAELEEFLQRKGKEWDAAKAAEDAAWERVLEALESQDSGKDMYGRIEDFMAQIDEEEKRALKIMERNTEIYEEEKERFRQGMTKGFFDD
ncbi:hypothetical protein F5X68DRAFT_232276 [Plectosphaerella plurivora]|uniref:Uncharacterized protein n=1 Tax=Plectosphaerella plurivora TaxID=936078 RepID=A0A9P8VCJ1_9PEZI|nr:hypothetical protein F5X68DRAFT_232276 [Plectosphaerella plurivora]